MITPSDTNVDSVDGSKAEEDDGDDWGDDFGDDDIDGNRSNEGDGEEEGGGEMQQKIAVSGNNEVDDDWGGDFEGEEDDWGAERNDEEEEEEGREIPFTSFEGTPESTEKKKQNSDEEDIRKLATLRLVADAELLRGLQSEVASLRRENEALRQTSPSRG